MAPQVPKDFLKKCKKDPSWCSKLSNTVLSHMKQDDIVKLNCGKKPQMVCNQTIAKLEGLCKKEFPKKVAHCKDAKIVMHSLTGCAGSLKRDANEATEGSGSTELYLGIGAVLLIVMVGAIAAYVYFFGAKKGGKAVKGPASKSKSKMAGKSKIGSRKSQASKKSSRKGSQRSKMSGASKGTKSRMSGKKK